MPQETDKWKKFLSDLGRPTLRGIRKCPKCGTKNGTRGNYCKNKSCDVVFRENGGKKKNSTEACKIYFSQSTYQIYSVRLRERGPDYRNFVQLPLNTQHTSTISIMPKCYLDLCNRNRQYPCHHIVAAQRCFAESQPLQIKNSLLNSLNMPTSFKEAICAYLQEPSETLDLVQRVSKTSFVVKCNLTSKHPLGFLHIIFIKPNAKEGNHSEKRVICSCCKQAKDSDYIKNADPNKTMCIHYYACICAFASSEDLSIEFDCFLSQSHNQQYTPILSHLLVLPNTENVRDVDLDPRISVEIMRDEISLLESLTNADDISQVQDLEGVLSTDQIIVTSVDDDTLNFEDPTTLDLETSTLETNQQVCLFSNTQNIALTSFTNQNDNGSQSLSINTNTQIIEGDLISNIASEVNESSIISTTELLLRKRKIDSKNNSLIDHEMAIKNNISKNKAILSKDASVKPLSTFKAATILSPTLAQISFNDKKEETVLAFDKWLSGVNERINLSMNYSFNGKPEPHVYFIPQDFFECLKERIIFGVKKKRLPNQTLIIERKDKVPLGTFTKHVWKISNLLQILQIFGCSSVRIKPSQYFIKNASGRFDEWIYTREDDPKHAPIYPVLHNTYLKIGFDIHTKESYSFIIEWIPDIFPQSKVGELTLIFQFGHSCEKSAQKENSNNNQ